MSKGKKNTKLPSAAGETWDEALVKEEVADSSWDFYLLFVVPEHPYADEHLNILKQAIERGQRRKFVLFDKETILQKANEDLKTAASAGRGGGGGKSKLGSAMQDRPMYSEVCEHIVNAIGSGEGVPASLLARFIKYCLIKRKKADLSTEAQHKESAAQSTDVKSAKKGAAGAGKAVKKGKATPAMEEDAIPLPQKPPTNMKKRGEEEDDVKYIDDEPEVGPQSYIILSGFTEAELIHELILININVHCVLRLQSEKISKEISDEESAKVNVQLSYLSEFWLLLGEICSTAKVLQNVALVDILAPKRTVPTVDDEKELYGTELFNILAQKIYELLTLYTQYKHYMSFLNILNVPFITNLQASGAPSNRTQDSDNKEKSVSHPPSAAEQPSISRDLRYYNHLMSNVPEESSDIGLILYCLVEQVSLNVLGHLPACGKNMLTRSEQPINAKLQEKLNSFIGELALSSTDKQELLASSTSSTKVTTHPMRNHLVSSRDFLQQRTYHLRSPNEFDIHVSSTHALESLRLARLLRTISQHVKEYCFDDASINALDNFCITEDVSQASLQHALALLTLEYLYIPNASLTPSYSMQLQNVVFDHPFLLKLKDNNICCEVLKPSIFAPVESYCVQEYMDEFAVVQQLQTLQLTTHPYLDCFHHKHLKSAILVANTGYDGKPLHQYSWLAQSHFPLGFQDYIQYVAKSFGDDVDKAVALEAERITMTHDLGQKGTQEVVPHELPTDSPLQKLAKTSANGKKSKAEACVPSSKDLFSADPSYLDSENVKKLFNAYDLGGTPLLCKGLVRTAFTADGSQIRTETLEFIKKPVTLFTTVLDGANKVTTYFVCGRKDTVHKATKTTEQITEDDASKAEISLSPPPALLTTIPQPINNVICCGLQASFKDSVTVSLSHFGPDGNGDFPLKPELPKVLRESNSATSSRPQSQATPPPPQKLSKKQLEQQQQMLEDQKRLEEQRKRAQAEYAEKWNALVTQCKYQQLYASNSCGLHIHCQVFSDPHSNPAHTSGDDSYIVVRQSYHCKGSGSQDCEQVLLQAAYQEHHRCYLPDGSVICFRDQSVVIQNADGSSVRTASLHEQEQYAKLSSSSFVKMRNTQAPEVTDRMKSAASAISFASDVTRGEDTTMDKSLWIVTTATGERFFWKDLSSTTLKFEDVKATENGGDTCNYPLDDISTNETAAKSLLKLSPIRICSSTDPVTKEEIVTREDNTMILYQPDGSYISEFADGTRITTVVENGAKPKEIVVECPGYARINYTFPSSVCTITFPDFSVIECNTDGSYCIRKTDNYRLQINKDGDASYVNMSQPAKQKYSFTHHGATNLLQYCDSKGNNFNTDLSGQISMDNEKISVPIHSNFLPLYYWIPGDAPPYLLLPESTLHQVIANAKASADSVVIKDTDSLDCLVSSTVIKPSSSGLRQNYQVQYARDTLLPVNVHGSHLILSNKKSILPCKALQYQHFACRAPIDRTVRQQVLQGIVKYMSWREMQETTSNSLLSNMKKEAKEIQIVQALDSKWKNAVPSSLLSTEMLLVKYMENMMPKPALKNKPPLEIILPKQHNRKSEQIDDIKKVLRENKHPPYFSLYQPEVIRSTQMQNASEVKKQACNPPLVAPEVESSNSCLLVHTRAGSIYQDSNIVQQNHTQSGSLKSKEITRTTAAGKTESGQRGLGLFPEEVNFGVIDAPGIYSQTVNVRNNGIKPARLKVKQLHGTIEMKLKYAPGPIAPGMSRAITVEMTFSESTSAIKDDCSLEISSETAAVLVPIKANILLNQK